MKHVLIFRCFGQGSKFTTTIVALLDSTMIYFEWMSNIHVIFFDIDSSFDLYVELVESIRNIQIIMTR